MSILSKKRKMLFIFPRQSVTLTPLSFAFCAKKTKDLKKEVSNSNKKVLSSNWTLINLPLLWTKSGLVEVKRAECNDWKICGNEIIFQPPGFVTIRSYYLFLPNFMILVLQIIAVILNYNTRLVI